MLTREFPPDVYGGAGVHVEHLAGALSGLVDLQIHCFGESRSSPNVAAYQASAELAALGPRGAALQAISIDLMMAVGASGADLVHSHTWYTNFGGHLARLLYDIPHVCTTHSLEPLRPWKAEQLGAGGFALSSFCERVALESADAIIAVSEAMRHDVLATYPTVEPSRVRVIYNGVDLDEYRPDHRTDVLERHGIDPGRPIVIFLGRITRQKGLDHLLRAAPMIDPAAQLVLCAGAPDTPGLAAEVRDSVARLKQTRTVAWIEQMLPRPDVVQLLSHASVFVCPSIYEPFGLVNLEAMACQLPVVASRTGGIPEIVVEGETGFLVAFDRGDDEIGSPRNAPLFARGLADAVNRLLHDRALAKRLGAAGRKRLLEHFTWKAIARATADLYEEVLQEKMRRHGGGV